MTLGHRGKAVGAILFVVAGVGAALAVAVTLSHDPRPKRRTTVAELLGAGIQSARATLEARRSADVVVDRHVSGALTVSGRAIRERARLASPEELRRFLTTLPNGGTAVVTIAYTSNAGGIQGVTAPTPVDAARAQRELWEVLESAGFTRAGGDVEVMAVPSAQ